MLFARLMLIFSLGVGPSSALAQAEDNKSHPRTYGKVQPPETTRKSDSSQGSREKYLLSESDRKWINTLPPEQRDIVERYARAQVEEAKRKNWQGLSDLRSREQVPKRAEDSDRRWIASLAPEARALVNNLSQAQIEEARRNGSWDKLRKLAEQLSAVKNPLARSKATSQSVPPRSTEGRSTKGPNEPPEFSESDQKWINTLSPEWRRIVDSFTHAQVDEAKRNRTWIALKRAVEDFNNSNSSQ